ENLAACIDGNLGGEVSLRDSGRNLRDISNLRREVTGHRVHRFGEVFPHARNAFDVSLATQLSIGAYFSRDARHLARERIQLVHHRVNGVLKFKNFALSIDRNLRGEIAFCDARGHFRDVSHLPCQVASHRVDTIGEVLPNTRNSANICLSAKLSVRTYLARHARYFAGEPVELVHHGVDRVFEFEDLAARVDRDLSREIAIGDARGHLGDIAHLVGQVAGHGVHAVREILPDTGNALHPCLATELAFCAYFASHTGHFAGEPVQLLGHGVHELGGLEKFAGERLVVYFQGHPLAEVALGHGADYATHFSSGLHEVGDQLVDGIDGCSPPAGGRRQGDALIDAAFPSHCIVNPHYLAGEALLAFQNLVQSVGHFASQAGLVWSHAG